MSNSDFLSLGERPSIVLEGEGRVFDLGVCIASCIMVYMWAYSLHPWCSLGVGSGS